MAKKSVLFVCTHNSARSQMAEGLLRHLYGDKYEVASAGTLPGEVNPYAVAVMKEIGIDISRHRSKSVEEFRGKTFDIVVTVCDHARETCPFFPGKRVLHRGFEDPSRARGTPEEILQKFREVRDEIFLWLKENF